MKITLEDALTCNFYIPQVPKPYNKTKKNKNKKKTTNFTPHLYFGDQIRKVLVMVNLKLYTDREAEAVVKDQKEKIQAEVRCIQKKRMPVENELKVVVVNIYQKFL